MIWILCGNHSSHGYCSSILIRVVSLGNQEFPLFGVEQAHQFILKRRSRFVVQKRRSVPCINGAQHCKPDRQQVLLASFHISLINQFIDHYRINDGVDNKPCGVPEVWPDPRILRRRARTLSRTADPGPVKLQGHHRVCCRHSRLFGNDQ